MAPDIEWITMWHYKVEGRGPERVAEGLFKPLMAEWASFALVPTEFIAEGDNVVSWASSPTCMAPPENPPRPATRMFGRC